MEEAVIHRQSIIVRGLLVHVGSDKYVNSLALMLWLFVDKRGDTPAGMHLDAQYATR